MTDAASPPAPAAPAAPPPATPSPAVSRYLEAWQGKRDAMRKSWQRSALWLVGLTAIGVWAAIRIGELGPRFTAWRDALGAWLLTRHAPAWTPTLLSYLLPAVILLATVLVIPLVLVWWERKVSAHMQGRLGPMATGGWHGWAQTIADGIKLMLKESFTPEGADPWVYRLAPVIVFLSVYLSYGPLPFGRGLIALDLDAGLLYLLAVSGFATIGLLMAGWASANKYSLLGGLRAAAQVVSYEIPRLLSVVPVVMWAGSLSLPAIIEAQSAPVGGWFPRWFIFYPVVGQISFVIYLITTIAETNRVPFDAPEAESELVAGFHTEYGGLNFGFFFLAEYAYMVAGSLIGAALFLGGGGAPTPALAAFPSWAWFLVKTVFLVFVFMWARWTLPRLRIDRVMDLCWKVFLPWTLINIAIAGASILWRSR